VSGAVARVTLDDPGRRNILSGALVGELTAAFDELEGRGAVTAVVLTGAGPAFCAGADLADLLAGADGDPAPVRRVYSGFDRVRRSPLLTIAAVNGPAVGAGMNLALVCDLRIAADELAARIGRAPRELVLTTKRSLGEEADLTAEAAMELEEQRQMWSLQLPSTAQGLRALARR
jgi:enoyl-CoA hydratase/carnithine racemase